MADKKDTAKLELTRREQEVVKGFADNWLALHRLHESDARQRIYEEMVKHKYGEYTGEGERRTREPMWNLVLPKDLCPLCNSDEEILADTAANIFEENEENLLCKACGFTIPASLWTEGKKSNEIEKKINDKDREFTEKLGKYKMPEERIGELAKRGIMEAQRTVRLTTPEHEEEK